jgi:hypothetical protein
MGLNIEKYEKTGQFLLGTSEVTRKGVSIYGLVCIRLYYTPIRQKKMEMLDNSLIISFNKICTTVYELHGKAHSRPHVNLFLL